MANGAPPPGGATLACLCDRFSAVAQNALDRRKSVFGAILGAECQWLSIGYCHPRAANAAEKKLAAAAKNSFLNVHSAQSRHESRSLHFSSDSPRTGGAYQFGVASDLSAGPHGTEVARYSQLRGYRRSRPQKPVRRD